MINDCHNYFQSSFWYFNERTRTLIVSSSMKHSIKFATWNEVKQATHEWNYILLPFMLNHFENASIYSFPILSGWVCLYLCIIKLSNFCAEYFKTRKWLAQVWNSKHIHSVTWENISKCLHWLEEKEPRDIQPVMKSILFFSLFVGVCVCVCNRVNLLHNGLEFNELQLIVEDALASFISFSSGLPIRLLSFLLPFI